MNEIFINDSERIKRASMLFEVAEKHIKIYRSSGSERKKIVLWEEKESAADILALLLIGESTIYGLTQSLCKKELSNHINKKQFEYLENISPFKNVTFMCWFSEFKDNYPKTVQRVILLEYIRLELIDLLSVINLRN